MPIFIMLDGMLGCVHQPFDCHNTTFEMEVASSESIVAGMLLRTIVVDKK